MKRSALALLGCLMLAATGCCSSMGSGCNSGCGMGMGSGCGMFGSGCGMFGSGCNNCNSGCDYALPTYDGNYGAPINYGANYGMPMHGGQPGCNCGNGQQMNNGPTYAPGVTGITPYQGQVFQGQQFQGQFVNGGVVEDGGWGATINSAPQSLTLTPAVPQIQGQSYQFEPQTMAPRL